ncbi:sigma-54-dependent Fis family transcriptional regulator [Clostridium scatologenes]|uniref:Putative sigma54 specific transcriptional regulator n=1 Tax=Clostridium scatologenes TaxID=1548 RepID=A0A0E3M8A7_CLOSL|nr:sigma 54-interacting transcriptional regulator [Clostridium scatologenes]AKA69547.1 putative sigma54 specific transcriptional regulator [Clostridium scatologenes]
MMRQIKEELQEIAETIKAVIGIDITIMDKNLLRIAGTGKFKAKIGFQGPENSVFQKCIITGQPYFIENPKLCSECIVCSFREECDEKAEICFPIIIDDKVEAVIGMIIFEDEQKEAFLQKQDIYKDFEKRLGELISSRMKEKNFNNRLEYKSKELLTVINSVNEGIIIINKQNKILNLNTYIVDKFNIKFSDIIGKNIDFILPNKYVNKFVKAKYSLEEESVEVSRGSLRYNFLVTCKSIKVNNKISGAVITFKDFNKLQQSVLKISGKHSIVTFDDIIGDSSVFDGVKEQARHVAKQNVPVLLLGESGTGKELFARAIHFESERRNEIFMAINCGAIPDSLVESELFGYEKGAFTGANTNGKMGKFEIAKDGTIFLDEIGDLPLHMQVKLLRILEDKELIRVGGVNTIKVNPRIVAATHKNLYKMVERNEFRKDLFYRLNVIPINVPALRERPSDILKLSIYFLNRYNKIYNKDIKGFSESAQNKLITYSWPGNVRELQNLIEYAINFENSEYIKVETIIKRITGDKDVYIKNRGLKEMVGEYEKKVINKLIEYYGCDTDSKKMIAKKLKISSATLYRKLEK